VSLLKWHGSSVATGKSSSARQERKALRGRQYSKGLMRHGSPA